MVPRTLHNDRVELLEQMFTNLYGGMKNDLIREALKNPEEY